MSSIARIFIVLNLLLSALALGWAANFMGTHQDFKVKYDNAVEEKNTLEAELNEQLSDTKAEVNTQKERAQRLMGEREQVAAERDKLTSDVSTLESANSQMRGALDGINQTLSSVNESKDQAVSRLEQAMADLNEAKEARREAEEAAKEAGDKQRDAEEALANAERTISDLETQVTSLAKDLEDRNTTLDTIAAQYGVDPTKIFAQPTIDGAVVSVSTTVKPGLIGINRGKADGVRRGFIFNIYSGNQFKGTAKVETVEDNMCYATIQSVYENRTMAQGDKAATRL